MNNTEATLHLIRCVPMTVTNPRVREAMAAGLAEVKRGQVRLTPAGHAFLRGK